MVPISSPEYFLQIPQLNLPTVAQGKSDSLTLLTSQKKILDKEPFRSVSTMPGALFAMITFLITQMLKSFVTNLWGLVLMV